MLGEERWECVEKEERESDLLGEEQSDGQTYTRSYKRWLIEYIDEQGNREAFWIDNFANRKKRSKLSNKVTFGMEISDYLCERAKDMITKEIVEANFEDIKNANDDISIDVDVVSNGKKTKTYYKNLVTNIADYNIESFTPKNLLENKDEEFMIQIQVQSFQQNSESIAAIDEKIENMKNQILETYGEHATYFIETTHFKSEEFSMEDEDIINCYYKMAYNGKEISISEVENAVGECSDYFDLGEYIEKIK